MLVTKTSPFTGEVHTKEVPCTPEEFARWASGTPIQRAMPNVSPELREFVATGITPEEWEELLG